MLVRASGMTGFLLNRAGSYASLEISAGLLPPEERCFLSNK